LMGYAELPLHDGHVPRWMLRYMERLAEAIVAVIVEEYGPRELVRRLANPYWFQAFNNAIGMDWDSSGSTTVTTAVLKKVAMRGNYGFMVAGGKGQAARRTIEELEEHGTRIAGEKAREAMRASRLAAKADTVLLQDGYTLYHHAVILAEDGTWCVIQQGMNTVKKMARRYHWLSPLNPGRETLEPHAGIAAAEKEEAVIDLTSRRSMEARSTILDLARQRPEKTLREIMEAYRALRGIAPLTRWLGNNPEPRGRVIVKAYRPQQRPPRGIEKKLRIIYEADPRSIEELIQLRGVGPAVLRSLALVSELIYGSPVSHEDPADTSIDPFRYAYIVGGKDGVPFPYNPRLAEEVIEFLTMVVEEARIGVNEKRRVLRRLRILLAPGRQQPRHTP